MDTWSNLHSQVLLKVVILKDTVRLRYVSVVHIHTYKSSIDRGDAVLLCFIRDILLYK